MQTLDALVPVVCNDHCWRLIRQLYAAARRAAPAATATSVGNVVEGKGNLKKFAALILFDHHADKREQIVGSAGTNPLLQHRIGNVRARLVTPGALLAQCRQHETRIRWHLRRIYRARNMMAHNSTAFPYLGILVENLHTYVDALIRELVIALLLGYGGNSVASALESLQVTRQAHRKKLEETSPEVRLDASDYVTFLGPKSAIDKLNRA